MDAQEMGGCMGLFKKKDEEEIAGYRQEIQRLRIDLKASKSDLAAARQSDATMSDQVENLTQQVQQLKAAVTQARVRQKSSVERANRFKAQLTALLSTMRQH
ncbi:hypothetical protein [Herbaspirillum sp. CAH-3]|uniref:hypothetical protein n=1 Tax=Herbaspirillum sp. CAH-3 TaxID=2605746 RepID=UPI0012ACD046|nr:hypothetical protein [Herbaspirillum sp. CAH-3]MRT30026.1 hypothetical protein [Herbaspirillum sp. CAH-3]